MMQLSLRLILSCGLGDREIERASRAGSRLHPHSSPVQFHALLAERKPNPIPRIVLLRMQALENGEYPAEILRMNSDPVVSDGKLPEVVLLPASDPEFGRHVFPFEFHGIADQVLKYLAQFQSQCMEGGQFPYVYSCAG